MGEKKTVEPLSSSYILNFPKERRLSHKPKLRFKDNEKMTLNKVKFDKPVGGVSSGPELMDK